MGSLQNPCPYRTYSFRIFRVALLFICQGTLLVLFRRNSDIISWSSFCVKTFLKSFLILIFCGPSGLSCPVPRSTLLFAVDFYYNIKSKNLSTHNFKKLYIFDSSDLTASSYGRKIWKHLHNGTSSCYIGS